MKPWPLARLLGLFVGNPLEAMLRKRERFGKVFGDFHLGCPKLVIADAQLVQRITIKDFDSFPNHQVSPWSNKYQANFLVWLRDAHWRRARALITPAFTSAKIRRMYALMESCADDLVESFGVLVARGARRTEVGPAGPALDLPQLYGLYTLDSITTCCYGLKLRSERAAGPEGRAQHPVARDCALFLRVRWLRIIAAILIPEALLKLVGFKMSPENECLPLANRVQRLIERRRKESASGSSADLLQLLVKARLETRAQLELDTLDEAENHHAGLTSDELRGCHERHSSQALGSDQQGSCQLTDFEILSEATMMLVAGVHTTKVLLSTVSFLLAHNEQVQTRLRRELESVRSTQKTGTDDQEFEYEALTRCEYLDAVISETLRFFGPVALTDRQAACDYDLDDKVRVRAGSQVLIGIYALHHDPDYWSRPEEFNPQRFMGEERAKIVPGSYCPFGLGPRHCIGMRFSLTEAKLALAKLLLRFHFSPAPNTRYPPVPAAGATAGLAQVLSLIHI